MKQNLKPGSLGPAPTLLLMLVPTQTHPATHQFIQWLKEGDSASFSLYQDELGSNSVKASGSCLLPWDTACYLTSYLASFLPGTYHRHWLLPYSFFFFLMFALFKLKCNWFTVLCQFLLYRKVTQSYFIHTHTFFFSYLPLRSISRDWM